MAAEDPKKSRTPMKTKGKPRKDPARMSIYEKRHARTLYIRGKTQQQIAEAIGYTREAVKNLKKFEGDWEEHRLPLYSDIDVLANLKDILFRIQSDMINENDPDLDGKVNNVKKIVLAIKHLQELVDDVTIRDQQIGLKRHIEWIAVHKPEGSPIEVAQKHYDWCQDHL